jgi:hypothetical protein
VKEPVKQVIEGKYRARGLYKGVSTFFNTLGGEAAVLGKKVKDVGKQILPS